MKHYKLFQRMGLLLLTCLLIGCEPPVAIFVTTLPSTPLPTVSSTLQPSTETTTTPLPPSDQQITPTVPFQPPPCQLGRDSIPPQVAPLPLTAYEFSEPRIVLTHTSAIDIAGWLPDGHRLLITRRILQQPRHYVEIFDVQTGETRRYGEGSAIGTLNGANKPIWLDDEQAVAYADFSSDNQTVLRINRGEGELVEDAVTGLASPHLAASLDGSQAIYFSAEDKERPQVFDLAQSRTRSLAIDLHLPVQDTPSADYLAHYQIAPHPDGNQIAFYNNSAFYLADTSNGQACELDLGMYGGRKQWAVSAHWSPDGRYLAAFTVIGDPVFSFTDLALIDTITGERHSIDLEMRYFYTLVWDPNSRNALVIATDFSEQVLHRLYLVDVITGNYRPVLQDYPFRNSGNWGVAWSNQGYIALGCPVLTSDRSLEGRLCIIAVETK